MVLLFKKLIAIILAIIIGIPLGVIVGVVSFLKFPVEVVISALKKIDEQEKQKQLISQQYEKDVWQRHIDRMNNNQNEY